MIINTGQRTDIPAFYPKWLANRFKEQVVCVRNPFNKEQEKSAPAIFQEILELMIAAAIFADTVMPIMI